MVEPSVKITDPAHLEKVKQFYARCGDSYYQSQYPYFITVQDLYHRCLVEIFEEQKFGGPFGTVLDIGCGTGTHLIYAAQFCPQAIGIDVSPTSIEQARIKVKERGLTNVELICSDLNQNRLPDASVDCVISYGDVLGHIPDYRKAISELSRICRPGALLSMEFDNKWYLRLLYDREERREALKNTKEGHLRAWNYQGELLCLNTFTHQEMVTLLSQHQFRVLRTYGFDFFTYLLPERYHFSNRRGWFERMALVLGKLDIALRGVWPINRFGYSKIMFAQKQPSP